MTIISIEIKVNINKGKNGVEHMILKIAIADKNSEYIRRILNVLETYGDIDVSVFTDEKSLEGHWIIENLMYFYLMNLSYRE